MSTKEEQETKKIKVGKSETENLPSEKIKEQSFEDWSNSFTPVKNGKGTLLEAKQNIKLIMKIPDNSPVTVYAGENLLVLHMFEHIETNEKAIIFLTGEQKCMYLTENFDTDFTVIHEGNETDVFSE